MPEYIKKYWDVPDTQPAGRTFPAGFSSPDLEAINNFQVMVSDAEYLKVMSALMIGAKIAYPDEYGALVDIWLAMALGSNDYVGDGTYYPPYARFVKWYPVSPYRTDLNQTPDPHQVLPAWNVYNFELPAILDYFLQFVGFDLETFTGYKTGDALSFIWNMAMEDVSEQVTDWLFGGDPDNNLKVGFDLHVRGSGTLAIEFLTVPFGGRVIWQVDHEPNVVDLFFGIFQSEDDLIETDKDLFSLPPETDTESVEEITIDDDGDHVVYVRLLPVLNDQIIPFSWGAGVRSIRLGDGLEPLDPETGDTYENDDSSHVGQNLGLITVSETDLYNALVRFKNDESSRWLFGSEASNIVNGVEIDPDSGTITVKQSGGGQGSVIEGLPQEVHYGGVSNQAIQFKKLLDELNANITATYSVPTLINLTRIAVNPLDLAAWSSLITDYNTADPQVTIDATELALKLFCADSYEGVLNYAIAEHSASEEDLNFIVQFASEIPPSTWSKWYEAGKTTPKLGAEASSCYRHPLASYEIDDSNFATGFVTWDTRGIVNHRHRLEIKVIEPMSDGAGKLYDGVWYKNGGAAAVSTYMTRLVSSGGQIVASSAAQSYKAGSGTYVLEYTVPTTLTGTWFNNVPIVPVSGSMILTLYDLGAV